MQPQRGIATEHAATLANGARDQTILKPTAHTLQQMKEAPTDRTDNTFEHLPYQLADFFATMLENA